MSERKTVVLPDGVAMTKQELKDNGLSWMTDINLDDGTDRVIVKKRITE